jgi:hypothetical protein
MRATYIRTRSGAYRSIASLGRLYPTRNRAQHVLHIHRVAELTLLKLAEPDNNDM